MGWNYYLDIPKEQIPDNLQGRFSLRSKAFQISPDSRVRYFHDYSSVPIISDLDWHGGITLYEKHYDERGRLNGYRLGCDYQHHFDQGLHYTANAVAQDARHSVDMLWELVPDLKLRCAWNGKYYDHDKVYYTDKGVCVAIENKARWEKPLAQTTTGGG